MVLGSFDQCRILQYTIFTTGKLRPAFMLCPNLTFQPAEFFLLTEYMGFYLVDCPQFSLAVSGFHSPIYLMHISRKFVDQEQINIINNFVVINNSFLTMPDLRQASPASFYCSVEIIDIEDTKMLK